jgi:hypothetical protein
MGKLVNSHKGYIGPQRSFFLHFNMSFLSLKVEIRKLLSLLSKKHGSLSLSSPSFQNNILSWIELMIWYLHEQGTKRSLDLA